MPLRPYCRNSNGDFNSGPTAPSKNPVVGSKFSSFLPSALTFYEALQKRFEEHEKVTLSRIPDRNAIADSIKILLGKGR